MKIFKSYLPISLLFCLLILLASWGSVGHHAIGQIAENHLSENAHKAVKDLLGTATLADVSTYADEIRSNPEFKYTSTWHYINLSPGLDFEKFAEKVKGMPGPNVYTALLKKEQDLKDSSNTKEEKIFALKWIVHLVGDLHQPMHVSRAEDKGGNAIHVTFNHKESNLHRLWDTDLIEHQGYSFQQLAANYDHISKGRIRRWQKTDIIQWLYESYQLSNKLYADVARDSVISEKYFRSHRKMIRKRIVQAGIRLAGVLNEAFSSGLIYKK